MKRCNFQEVWLISVWLCLGGLGLTADPNRPTIAKSDGKPLRPPLQVFVYNYASLSSGDLKLAIEVATDIYRNVGIRLEWLDCYSTVGEPNYNTECRQGKPTRLVLRILPRSQAEGLKQPASALGFAILNDSGDLAHYANVFYHRVEELSGRWTSSRPVVLGHVMAHEMGHLLLGARNHSRTGLMIANWDRAELEQVNRRAFTFSCQQAREIRARFLERCTAEVSRLSEVAEKSQVGDASDWDRERW